MERIGVLMEQVGIGGDDEQKDPVSSPTLRFAGQRQTKDRVKSLAQAFFYGMQCGSIGLTDIGH